MTELAEQIEYMPMRDPRIIRIIPVASLRIAQSQRNVDEDRCRTMADRWDWDCAEVPTVAERAGEPGVYDVIEGQHRVTALGMIGPDALIYCVVLQPESPAQQATNALAIDKGRTRISAVQRWDMEITKGDPHVVAGSRVLHKHGVRMTRSGGPSTTAAASAISSILRSKLRSPEEGAVLLDATLSVITEAWPTEPVSGRDERFNQAILGAISDVLAEGTQPKAVVKALHKQRRTADWWLALNGGGESRRSRITTTLRAEVAR